MKPPRTLAPAIDRIAREAVGRDWHLYAALLRHWAEIIGPSYAKNTSPVKIVFPKGKKPDESWAAKGRMDGVLTIKAPKGLSMELSFHAETIRERANLFLGGPVIARIALEPIYGAAPPKTAPSAVPLTAEATRALEAQTSQVEDPELREALRSLGESVLK